MGARLLIRNDPEKGNRVIIFNYETETDDTHRGDGVGAGMVDLVLFTKPDDDLLAVANSVTHLSLFLSHSPSHSLFLFFIASHQSPVYFVDML